MPEEGATRIKPGRISPRRRWWQHGVRLAVLLCLVGVVLYATLPWWLPKQFLARRFAQSLSRRLGLPVSIARLDMSWNEGIVLDGLRIANDAAFGGGDMVNVGGLRCELSPLRLLLTGRLGWAEINDAELHVVVDETGGVNLAALERLSGGSPPERLMVHRATVVVKLPRHQRLLRLNVSDLQYRSGRLTSLGRITMSAGLAQEGESAPVSLVASAGGEGGEPAMAACSFRFAKLDLGQLSLPVLLGLPLERLTGDGSGELVCRLNSVGVVDKFALAVKVKDLDAQPLSGPRLPVVKEAEISLDACYDHFKDPLPLFKANSFRIRLPGINLQGDAGIGGNSWQGIEALHVAGEINPATVLSLAGKATALPGGARIEGDVHVSFALDEKDRDLTSSLTLDATGAAVGLGQRTIKPTGRELKLDFHGSLSKQTWNFSADSAVLHLGGNHFDGSGAMQKVRNVLGHWLQAGDSATLGTLMDDLAAVDWRGACEITELESFKDLAGPAWPEQMRLSGRIEGQWSIEHSGMMLLRGSLRAPPGTELSAGPWFVKPTDKVLNLEASADVDIQAPKLKRLRLWAGVGEAGVAVDDGSLTFSVGDERGAESLGALMEGRFSVHDAGTILACVPAAKNWAGRLGGDIAGQFNLMRAGSFRRVHLEANAALMSVAVPDLFQKASGQPADLVADFATDAALPAAQRNRLVVRARLGAETVEAAVTFPPAAGADAPIRCRGRLAVADAAWLMQRVGRLGDPLRAYDPRGALRATLSAEIRPDGISGELACDADDLEVRLPQTSGVKPKGAPCRLRLAGRWDSKQAVIDLLAADLGRSSLSAEGTLLLAKADRPAASRAYWPPPRLAGIDLTLRARAAHDAVMHALLPSLAKQADALGIDGSIRLEGTLKGDEEGIDLAGKFDAADLVVAAGKNFRKSAGAPARGTFKARVPADFSLLQVQDLFLDGGGGQCRADATVPLLKDAAFNTHLAVNIPDLRRAAANSPVLGPYALEGSLLLDLELSRRDGRDAVKYVTFKAGNIMGVVGGKAFRLDGGGTLEDLVWTDNPAAAAPRAAGAEEVFTLDNLGRAGKNGTIGRIVSDSLEFALGESHGYVVADIRNPLTAPTGRAEVLCPNLDFYDLGEWEQPKTPPTAPVTTSLAPDPVKAGRQAEQFIALLRRFVLPGEVGIRLHIDRARYYDSEVKALYVVRGMVIALDAKNGLLQADYRCGLNGGEMEAKYSCNLAEGEPRLKVVGGMREIISAENILAQLAKEFPGNAVYGTFTRSHDLAYSLREVVMNSLDNRLRLAPVGTSVTITEDGLLRGRSAPRWITELLPGLNLITYRYRRMTGFTDYRADGSSESDMIFSGYNYDVYIEGATDPRRVGNYELGVILVGAPQSAEFNHNLRLGRVPILNFKARIENGQFYDEEVWYKLPTDTALIIFLKNNLLYRIWQTAFSKRGLQAIAHEPRAAAPPPASAPARTTPPASGPAATGRGAATPAKGR